jgi:mRNA interferase RelE/StbE
LTAGWRVETSSRARRDLRRLDPPVRARVVDAINRLVSEPPAGDVIKLQGREDEWRLRTGDWRVFMQLDSERRTVVVLRVLPRGRAYDR